MRNRGAVNTSSSGRASTARGHLRERIEALELARHTTHRTLFVTIRAKVKDNRLVRSQGANLVTLGALSTGEITLVTMAVVILVIMVTIFVVVLIIVATITGFIRWARGGIRRMGWLAAAALETGHGTMTS
jgi:hypothetical protein